MNISQTCQEFRNFRNQYQRSSVMLFGGYILLYLKCSAQVGRISYHGKRKTSISIFFYMNHTLICLVFFGGFHHHCHRSQLAIIAMEQAPHRFMIFLFKMLFLS